MVHDQSRQFRNLPEAGAITQCRDFWDLWPKRKKHASSPWIPVVWWKFLWKWLTTGPGPDVQTLCLPWWEIKVVVAEALENPVDSNNSAQGLGRGAHTHPSLWRVTTPEEKFTTPNHRSTDTQVRNPPHHTPRFYPCQIMETFSFKDWPSRHMRARH